jgi:hypothetical protein
MHFQFPNDGSGAINSSSLVSATSFSFSSSFVITAIQMRQ